MRSRRVGKPRGTGFAETSPRACKNEYSPDTLDNRRRSVLTMLGMAWGIATVVLLLLVIKLVRKI